jgi:hypothetical protein
MNNYELKQYAEKRFSDASDDSKVKWALVLVICLQTEAMLELNGNLLEAIDRI